VIIIIDTNILSSMAAADAWELLLRLFARSSLCIPPAVQRELQAGLARRRAHLAPLLAAIEEGQIQVLPLTAQERQLAETLPRKLNAGEAEALALAQSRQKPLLSNDGRAIRYGQAQGLTVIDLAAVLNLLWTRRVVSKRQVEHLIEKIARIEQLVLTPEQRRRVFAGHAKQD
jgi:predicted nucleic acid-binding protein